MDDHQTRIGIDCSFLSKDALYIYNHNFITLTKPFAYVLLFQSHPKIAYRIDMFWFKGLSDCLNVQDVVPLLLLCPSQLFNVQVVLQNAFKTTSGTRKSEKITIRLSKKRYTLNKSDKDHAKPLHVLSQPKYPRYKNLDVLWKNTSFSFHVFRFSF